jgi:hypothetical protein
MRRKSIWYYIFVLFLGAFLGTLLGELIGFVLPEGVVKQFFLKFAPIHVGPFDVNFVMLKITLGLFVKLNVVGLIGIILAAYILRWMD